MNKLKEEFANTELVKRIQSLEHIIDNNNVINEKLSSLKALQKKMINAKEFTKSYPLPCDKYIGTTDVQTDFMEMSRIGMCDLLDCLKNFVAVEQLEYSFSDFGFAKF